MPKSIAPAVIPAAVVCPQSECAGRVVEIMGGHYTSLRTSRAEIERVIVQEEERFSATLQSGLGLSEPEAFRWIQKTAMDLRKSMREVAEGVIEHGAAKKK